MKITNQQPKAKAVQQFFKYLALAATIIPLLVLAVLVIDVFIDGFSRLDWAFLSSFPSRHPKDAGIYPAIIGSLMVITATGLLAVPIGVGAALYLEEYARENWFTNLIEINIANLAGVPSVIYGLLGLEIFVRTLNWGSSILAAGATLALLILPIIIMASREAIRTVPEEVKEAAYGLGATQWQVMQRVVLPMSIPGILTGTILAISRAIGETAPLIVVGALTYMTFLPKGAMDPFTVLPIQIFNWTARPQDAFAINAAAGIVVLLITMLCLNAVAILLRNYFQEQY
jgi:phosphate transport system permease protein